MNQKKEMNPVLKKAKMKAKDIEAGGGVVYRESESNIEVLLIFRNGVWDIPKGKREKGETREECAKREVMEEVNAENLPIVINTLSPSFHSYEQKKKLFNKTTYWYTMVFEEDQNFAPERSEGIEKVEWVNITKAKEIVGYENLVQVLKDFQDKLST